MKQKRPTNFLKFVFKKRGQTISFYGGALCAKS